MVLTKNHAGRIAKKLGATPADKGGRAHDLKEIWHGGRLVAQFGVRRGSRKDIGHDHIPKELGISMRETKDLATCPMTREKYFEKIGAEGSSEPEPEK